MPDALSSTFLTMSPHATDHNNMKPRRYPSQQQIAGHVNNTHLDLHHLPSLPNTYRPVADTGHEATQRYPPLRTFVDRIPNTVSFVPGQLIDSQFGSPPQITRGRGTRERTMSIGSSHSGGVAVVHHSHINGRPTAGESYAGLPSWGSRPPLLVGTSTGANSFAHLQGSFSPTNVCLSDARTGRGESNDAEGSRSSRISSHWKHSAHSRSHVASLSSSRASTRFSSASTSSSKYAGNPELFCTVAGIESEGVDDRASIENSSHRSNTAVGERLQRREIQRNKVLSSAITQLSGASSIGLGGNGFGNAEGSGQNGAERGSEGSSNGIGSTQDGRGMDGNGFGESGGNGGEEGSGPGDEIAKQKAKKANPLVDLIETETAYVSELGKIIKKVAGAWSRSNFPPPELDTMFRNVESIYRINRGFLKSLKEIGPNPSSPRALGDLLMRWIDDLEAPYTRYCDNYFTDFDTWSAVQSNQKLPPLLEQISETSNSDGTPITFSDKKRQPGSIWTLDQLFALPQTRLKYYKKLYARLLKSTQQGRSDHRLLVGANEKLDELLERSKKRISMSVLDEGPIPRTTRQSMESSTGDTSNTVESAPTQRVSSATSASGERLSTDQVPPLPKETSPPFRAVVQPPPSTPSTESGLDQQAPPLAAPLNTVEEHQNTTANPRESQLEAADNLEYRLDTARTLDIFSMQPKKCQLRMNPLTLPFKRGLRKAADVVIYFTPSSTRQELALRRAHIFLLTDLFLVCERKTPSERAEGTTKADLWLLYPPLAGKHLRVNDMGGQGNTLSVVVLKKETLIVHLESRQAKEDWIHEFAECQKFATNLGLKLKTGPEQQQQSSSSNPLSASGTIPGVSPAISITPSTHDNDSIRSGSVINGLPPTSPISSLDREGSFNSFVAKPNGFSHPTSNGSPDLRIPPLSSPMQPPFTRSPSPSSSPALPPSTITRPGRPPGGHGPFRPDFVTPRPVGNPNPNGAGPMSSPPNGPMRPFMGRPGMGGSPPFRPMSPPLRGASAQAHNIGRPPMPPIPGGPAFPPSGGPARDPYRRPSAPDLRGNDNSKAFGRSTSGEFPGPSRTRSASSTGSGPPKLPSDFLKQPNSRPKENYSPPSSPVRQRQGPRSSTVAAQMRCRLYLKQSHAQWKSLGNARLKLYHLMPDDVKQLVVENDKKPDPIISSIILPDGVERVGKVGVAIELSDRGSRTGIIYMIHLRSEESAFALFGQLLEGSDRTVMGAEREAL